MLELWGMWSSPSLPSLPGPSGVVELDRVLSISQVGLNCLILVWFGLMVHQLLWVINAKSIFIHINSSISNNSA